MARNDRFRKRLSERIAKAQGKTDVFVKKLLVDIDKSLVQRSPVDTGRFKHNWMIGDGLINSLTTGDVSNTPLGVYDSKNAALINLIKVNGQTIYISNSLPYAKRLEMGYSGQAPAGMVGLTLVEVNSIANKVGVQVAKL